MIYVPPPAAGPAGSFFLTDQTEEMWFNLIYLAQLLLLFINLVQASSANTRCAGFTTNLEVLVEVSAP